MTIGADETGQQQALRAPSLLDALIPMLTLIVLLSLTIILFGIGATDGPLQVALMGSALVAGLVALKNGHQSSAISDAAIGGVSSAMGAIYILLGVGALIGTWNMAGTIPTVVAYGIELLKPSFFFAAGAPICALVRGRPRGPRETAGHPRLRLLGLGPPP